MKLACAKPQFGVVIVIRERHTKCAQLAPETIQRHRLRADCGSVLFSGPPHRIGDGFDTMVRVPTSTARRAIAST